MTGNPSSNLNQHGIYTNSGGYLRPKVADQITQICPVGSIDAQGLEPSARDALERAIEKEAIPRLLLARQGAVSEDTQGLAANGSTDADAVKSFVKLIRTRDISTACEHIEHLQMIGVPVESIWLDLLGGSANLLGEMWQRDECDFLEVTLCTWRLHEILRSTTLVGSTALEARTPKRRILIASLPGEQHSFGLALVEAFFRRAGWHVWSWPGASGDDLLRLAESEWFAVIGLSLSADEKLDALSSTIHNLRRASQNKSVGIVVGGPTFVHHPDWSQRVGANASAANGRQAVLQAHNLLALLS
jgi:methanogenic corrinoid protein MtbC1